MIDLQELQRQNKFYAPDLPNRVVLVLHFNPENAFLVVPHQNCQISKIKTKNYSFFEVKIQEGFLKSYKIYVFDHGFDKDIKLKVIGPTNEGYIE